MSLTIDTEAEQAALVVDAELRRRELVRVIGALWEDRDDEAVLAELLDLFGWLRQVEQALKETQR